MLGSQISFRAVIVLFNMQISTEKASRSSQELDERSMQAHKITKHHGNHWDGVQQVLCILHDCGQQ